jgi:hypothetical protein
MSTGADDPADEFDAELMVPTCAGYGDGAFGFYDPDEAFMWDEVAARAETLYDKLDIDDESGVGPVNHRTTTVSEVDGGHASVLEEFCRRPGRWLLWLEVDHSRCKDCGGGNGRFLQFAFLEHAAGVIGECSVNELLDEQHKYTPEQVDALRSLGWKDPLEGTTPNMYFLATTDEEVAALAVLTKRTLHEVFGLGPQDEVLIMFQQRMLAEEVG